MPKYRNALLQTEDNPGLVSAVMVRYDTSYYGNAPYGMVDCIDCAVRILTDRYGIDRGNIQTESDDALLMRWERHGNKTVLKVTGLAGERSRESGEFPGFILKLKQPVPVGHLAESKEETINVG